MTDGQGGTRNLHDLRARAERIVRQGVENLRTPAEQDALIHELQVHKAELQMQNDELHAAQAESDRLQNQYRHLFDFAPIGYLKTDDLGRIAHCNEAAAGLLGCGPGVLRGRLFSDFVDKDSQDAYYLHRRQVLKGDEACECELQMTCARSRRHFVEIRSISRIDTLGKREILMAIKDITARKRSEAELSRYRAHLEDLVERRTAELQEEASAREDAQQQLLSSNQMLEKAQAIAHVGSWSWDLESGAVRVSDELLRIFGRSRDEFGNSPHIEQIPRMIYPKDVDRVLSAIEKCMQKQWDRLDPIEFRIVRPDGEVRHVLGDAIHEDAGPGKSLVGVVQDITERKRMENDIRERDLKLATAIESLPFTFFIMDRNGRYTMQNSVARRRFGDVVGKRPRDIEVDEETLAVWETNNARAFSGEIVDAESTVRLGKETRCERNILSPIRQGGKVIGILGANIDTTERKMVELSLEWEARVNSGLADLANALIDPEVTIDDIAAAVVSQSRELTQSEFGYVCTVDPETDELVCLLPQPGDQKKDDSIAWESGSCTGGESLWQRAFLTKRAFYTNRAADQACAGELAGVRNFLGAPAMIGDEVLGQIVLMNSASDYTQHDLDTVRRVATLYALAMQRERQRQQLLRHQHHLEDMVAERAAELLETNRQLQAEVERRKQTAETLANREHQLDLFFSQSIDGFFFMMLDEPVKWDDTVDKDKVLDYVFEHQRITRLNEAMARQYRAHREQMIGMTPAEFFAHNPAEGKAAWRKLFDSGRLNIETEERRLDNSTMWVDGDYICLYDEEGRITGHVGIQRDITERRLAEQFLREQAKYVTKDPAPVLRVHYDGTVIWANPAAIEVLGERLPGKSIYDLIGDLQRPLLERIPEKRPRQVEAIVADSTFLLTFQRDEETKSVYIYASDITERKRAEELLLQNREQLKSLASQLTLAEERERRQLATRLHDEISQSLVISKIKLEALRNEGACSKSHQTIDRVCEELAAAIEASRSVTGELSYPILKELGFESAVAAWLRDKVGAHGIRTGFKCDKRPKPMSEDIQTLLFRSVKELLINAVKHSQARRVDVSIRRQGSEIEVTVKDDGVGFAPKQIASAVTEHYNLGLFSIYERLEQLGGSMEIESAPGQGCRVMMRAPLKTSSGK